MRNKAIIYARLSREDEDKIDENTESRSIENQIKLLSEYAIDNGFTVIKVLYDDGYSGGTMDRPAFNRLLLEIKAMSFDVLLVKDFSRIGRVMHVVGDFVENTLPKKGIRLICVGDKYDSNDPRNENDYSPVIKYFMNEYNLKDFKRKCRDARLHNANTKHLNYYPKFGYNFDEDGNEIIDEYAASVVRRAYRLIDEYEYPTCKIAEIFNREGIPTRSYYATEVLGLKALNKNPSRLWTAEKVWEILHDFEYCGHSINWVRHKKEERIVLKNTHHAIIGEELFFRVQEILRRRSKIKVKLNHIGKLLFDKETNRHMLYARSRYADYSSVYFLRVDKRQKYAIRARQIEDVLYEDALSVIEACRSDGERFYEIYKKRLFGGQKCEAAELKKELGDTNAEYAELLEKFVEGKIPDTIYSDRAGYLRKRIREIEQRITVAGEMESKLHVFDIKFKKFLQRLKNAPTDKISLIESVVSKVYINSISENHEYDISVIYKIEEI